MFTARHWAIHDDGSALVTRFVLHQLRAQRQQPRSPWPGAGVQLRDVTRRHGQDIAAITAVDDVSVSVQPGQAVALMGPSGSGKSTPRHLIGAMDQPHQRQHPK